MKARWLTLGACVVVSACTSGGTTAGTPAVPRGTASSPSTSLSSSAGSGSGNRYTLPEIDAARAISGVVHHLEPNHNHVEGVIAYDTSPPVGGNHSQYWADCAGTVYPSAIASENAVHALEHGAVWITYREGLSATEVGTLASLVAGADYTFLSPYPNLQSAVSLQVWGYQLFVDNANDPRVARFLGVFRRSPVVTPEYGATCAQPSFKAKPSTFGHPLWVPGG